MKLQNFTAARIMLALIVTASFGSPSFGAAADIWNNLISVGDLCETKHEHRKAIQTFDHAANFAKQNKLPSKCLELALCRQAAVEVQANAVAEANVHCDKLMSLVASEKAKNTLDPDLEVWILNLANAYQANLNPATREQCLEKLCLINKVLYGENHKDYKNARATLAQYYQQTQPLKAAKISNAVSQDALLQAEKNSDPMAQGYMLNQLAMNCRMTGDLEKAKTADLQLLKLAKTSPQVADGTIIYVASLGTIELAQGHAAESKNYFARARKEGAKIKGNQKKESLATASLTTLIDSVKSDKNIKYPNLLGDELEELLAVQQAISVEPAAQYNLNRLLGKTLTEEKRLDESDRHMARALEIAKLPASKLVNNIPELYSQWAMQYAHRGQIAKSNEFFAKALAAEPNKTGFSATRTLVYWGGTANNRSDFKLSEEKLGLAMKRAKTLPPSQRGTLLLDAIVGSMPALKSNGKLKEIQQLWAELIPERELQKKLNTGLGPNFFQQL